MTKLTVRLTDEEMKLLKELKEICRESTYNKTFVFALKRALQFYKLRSEVNGAIDNLKSVTHTPSFY
jgi:hypothetical protein